MYSLKKYKFIPKWNKLEKLWCCLTYTVVYLVMKIFLPALWTSSYDFVFKLLGLSPLPDTRLHPGHFWYGLSVPVEIFFAIFQVFWQYFKFFAIFQVFWHHFKIDSCMSINLVPCSINIKCISWYKHTYSLNKWH